MLRPLVLGLLLFPLAVGCNSSKPTQAGSMRESSAPAAAASAVVPSPSSTVSSAGAAVVGCDMRRGFHGTVAGKEAFLRVSRDGNRVVGRYFYASFGVDIALHGAISDSGELELDEGSAKSSTGHWKGTCDAATGALSGRWTIPGKELRFLFERVDSREPPVVATKRLSIKRKSKAAESYRLSECAYSQESFELFGAETPEAETALNRQNAQTTTVPILDQETWKGARTCERGFNAAFSRRVVAVFSGFVTVETDGDYYYDGAAYPGTFAGFSRITYSLATGQEMGKRQVLAKVPTALLQKCVAAYGKSRQSGEFIRIDGSRFSLTPQGVHFYGDDYEHVIASLTGEGPIVTWGALVREHAVRSDSPAQRLWKGTEASKVGKGDCVLASYREP